MTQLDSITWVPQIIWLFVIFGYLCRNVSLKYVPALFYSQKIRSQKISNHYSSTVFYNYLNVEVMFKRFATISKNFN